MSIVLDLENTKEYKQGTVLQSESGLDRKVMVYKGSYLPPGKKKPKRCPWRVTGSTREPKLLIGQNRYSNNPTN